MDGFDLSPILKGTEAVSPRTSFYYWSTKAELYAVRSNKWKLHLQQSEPVLYWNPTVPLDAPELYNLDADVSEKYDVAAKNPAIVSDLKKMAQEHLLDITDPLEDNLSAIIEED
jgi:arylsulfatase A-like enzyme